MTRLSNWKEESDLYEVVTGKMTDEKALKKVDEKKGIKNKVIINPKLTEAIKNMGGELVSIKEQDEENGNGGPLDSKAEAEKKSEEQKKKQIENKQKRAQMIKKQVLMKKLIAVRAGSEDIVAHYEPDIEGVIEYFYEEGINEEGFDQILEEIGLEEFVDFVEGGIVDLNEERAARKMSVRNLQTLKKKTIPAAKAAEAQRKKEGKGEYSAAYKKKETDVTVYDDKPTAKKKAIAKVAKKKAVAKKVLEKPVAKKPVTKKVVKAVAKVKKTQPAKKPSKQGLADKIRTAYKKGVERHKKAREAGRVPEKRAKEFASGVKSGVKTAVKFAKDVKKVVSKEEYETQKKKEVLTALKKRDLKKSTKEKIAADIVKRKGDTSKSDDRYAYEEVVHEAKVDKKLPDYKRATARDKRYGNPHGSHELGGGIRKDRRADHENRRGVKEGSAYGLWKGDGKRKLPGDKKKKEVKESRDKALDLVRASIIKKHGKGAIYDPKNPPKPPSEAEKKKAAAERKKRQDADNKAYAARAKKAGFKSTQDYTNVVARYGSEDNYKKGRGLGS